MKLAIFWLDPMSPFDSIPWSLWKPTQCFPPKDWLRSQPKRREIPSDLDGSSLGKWIIKNSTSNYLIKKNKGTPALKNNLTQQSNHQFARTMLFSEKVVRFSGRREIPKRHWANIISSAHMADCLWISSHEPRGQQSRTDPAIIPSQYVCTLIPVPGEHEAAASLTHHTELVGMWVLWYGGSAQQPLSKKIYCSIWQSVIH